jgi:hypothetical protein
VQSLREALWSSEAPEGSAAGMERTVEIAVGRFDRPGPAATRRLRRGFRVLAVVVGVVVALLALTPQGRDAVGAAAEQGSELLIGERDKVDDPGQPSRQQRDGSAQVGGPPTKGVEAPGFPADSPKVVLATGKTADGVPFEIVGYRSDRGQFAIVPYANDWGYRRVRQEGPSVCVNTEFPTAKSDGISGCYSGALNYGGLCCSQLSTTPKETSIPYIEGQVAPRVESVVVRYIDEAGDQRKVEAVIGMITPRFASLLEVKHPSGVFMTSLPGLAAVETGRFRGPAEPIEVTALTEKGAVVETETYPAAWSRLRRVCRDYEDWASKEGLNCEAILSRSSPETT